MSTLLASAPALPLHKAGKFVAGAYIVFVVLLVVYVAIMATRAQRLERELVELQREVEAMRAGEATPAAAGRVHGTTRADEAPRRGSEPGSGGAPARDPDYDAPAPTGSVL